MIVGVSANLLSRRTASPDLGRRAFGVWAFAAIGSPVALARAATLPTVASLRFGPHPPLEADGRGFVAGLAKSGFHVGDNILLAQHDCQGSMANANTLAAELLRAQPAVLHVSATPSAQAVNSAHGMAPQVPVVFSSVTDPLGAGIVNDALGHAAGDACLQAVAQVVKNAARRAGGLAARRWTCPTQTSRVTICWCAPIGPCTAPRTRGATPFRWPGRARWLRSRRRPGVSPLSLKPQTIEARSS